MRTAFFVMGFAALLDMGGSAEAGRRCTRDYAPVCARGPEGVRSYDNRNCARAAHARILRAGRCRKDIEAPAFDPHDGSLCSGDIDRPVCAEIGATRLTFPSVCHAVAARATVVTWGACWY
ncbi:hypothetical protein [Pinisolibacter sp.]|uniref:hypothetical protein n=1 Tax=Pinisolibacter sp. TaxID=2172024 RepID=UPI002FDC94B6